ncbi:MAG: RyR domain-containing protein [Alphaproteobacteria bacterium]
MAKSNGNPPAKIASWLTSVAHVRATGVRWVVLTALAGLWLWAGLVGWQATQSTPEEAFYKTIGALTYQDSYGAAPNLYLRIARYAGMFVPLVGLLFAFSGQLGASLAQSFHSFSADHIVIAGDSVAALSLAADCADKKQGHRDVVVLIANNLPEETARGLRRKGIMIISGDPTSADALRVARAHHANHVVAFSDDDTVNLRIEAAVRALVKQLNRMSDVQVHLAMRSPILLQEAREMRAQIQRDHDKAGTKPPPIETRPFSLDELAARQWAKERSYFVLQVGEAKGHPHPHVVLLGFDETAEAVAVRALMSLWSARFGEPRVTVVTPNAKAAAARFDTRYPQARSHEIWKADIEFIALDWRESSITEDVLQGIQDKRGQPGAVIISTGSDSDNIALALGVLRACNAGLADDEGKALWPVPIYMKEASESEFSREFAAGDRTPDVDDAFIETFGAVDRTATRQLIIEGRMDEGAAMAHKIYLEGVAARGKHTARELEAVRRGWRDIGETYRSASRAVADHAMVKMWDAGWMPAADGEKGEMAPEMSDAEIMRLAEMEHKRWTAERLLTGWRPGDNRDNRLRVHPDIKPWAELTDENKAKDVDQVRNSMMLARAMHKNGFKRRGAEPM